MTADWEWRQTKKKDGSLGRWTWGYGPEYTKLVECQRCGIKSTPKKVQYRPLAWTWNRLDKKDYRTPSKGVLCMGCWNKVRPLVKRADEAEEMRLLINQLQRKIDYDRKQNHQDHGRTARLPGDDDGGSEER